MAFTVDAINDDTGKLERDVALMLTEQGLTVAVAESCTGGLLSKRLTDIPGASGFFMGGIVSYNVQSKISLLGVNSGLIRERGVVSREVALAMADCAREKFVSDFGIGITGIAGPEGDGSGINVGTVFVAMTTKDVSLHRDLHLTHDRNRIRIAASSRALDMMRKYLNGL